MRPVLLVVFAAILASFALSACGSSEAEDEPQKLTFTVEKKGKGNSIKGPKEATTGLAEITLVNKGQGATDMQLVRVEGEHSAQEASAALGQAIEGNAFPKWFFAAGGVKTILPNQRETVTQVLQPGTYYAFYTEGQQGPLNRPTPAALEVSGEESDAEVEGARTIRLFEYGYESEPLPAGGVEVVLANTGDEPHHLIASKLVGKGTLKEAEKFLKTEKGKSPLTEEGFQATSVLEGGEDQAVTLDLEPGRYVFYCFVADRKGGTPHLFKGMIDEVQVEAAKKGRQRGP
jgi:hypothetical protein